MSAPDRDADELDTGEADAVGLLRGLPTERPPEALAAAVVDQVRPVAARRRRVFVVAGAAAVLGYAALAAAWWMFGSGAGS